MSLVFFVSSCCVLTLFSSLFFHSKFTKGSRLWNRKCIFISRQAFICFYGRSVVRPFGFDAFVSFSFNKFFIDPFGGPFALLFYFGSLLAIFFVCVCQLQSFFFKYYDLARSSFFFSLANFVSYPNKPKSYLLVFILKKQILFALGWFGFIFFFCAIFSFGES